MEITNIAEFLSLIAALPPRWQITFVVVFFLLPRVIQMFGGGKAIKEVVRKYQERKLIQVQGLALTNQQLEATNKKLDRLIVILTLSLESQHSDDVSDQKVPQDSHPSVHS